MDARESPSYQSTLDDLRHLDISSRDFQPVISSAPNCNSCAAAATVIRLGKAAPESLVVHGSLGLGVRSVSVGVYRRNASTCQTCRVLLAELTAHCAFLNQEPPIDPYMVEIVYYQFSGSWRIQLVAAVPPGFPGSPQCKSDLGFVRWVQPQAPGASPLPSLRNEHFSAPVDESAIDFDRIKRWKAYCDNNHVGTCHTIQDSWRRWDNVDKLLLVDVATECISRQPGSTVYLAFSYVWGVEVTPLVANMSNIDALCQPGSLTSSSTLGGRLPRTIRDAMTATSRLGYRYLWVDRLCIVQDDLAHKQHQLEGMAAIYANASITLIGTYGDDSHGLPGVEAGHSPPRRPHSIISLSENVSLLFDDAKDFGEPYVRQSDHTHRRRGWTLQEELLSNRTLAFSHREVKWQCQKTRCREILDDERQLRDNRQSSNEVKLYQPTYDIRTYGHLAQDYTGRLLTFDSDAVHAFSAIIAAFSRSMQDGMHFGLPELLFEGALLWHPRLPLRRRAAAPSWSFLGWAGMGLDLGTWSELYLNEGRRGDKERAFRSEHHISSCVDFFKVDGGSGARERIRSSYRPTQPEEQSVSSADCGSSRGRATRTPAALERNATHFVPTPIPSAPLPFSLGSWLPVLEFRTRRCRSIQVGDAVRRTPDDGADSCLDLYLTDQDGRIVGALRLNASDAGDDASPGTRLDLIVISRCTTFQTRFTRMIPELRLFHARCTQPCFIPERCEADSSLFPYDFYNVMWVGWTGNIAHRRAVGRVLASCWDAQELEEVHVTLG